MSAHSTGYFKHLDVSNGKLADIRFPSREVYDPQIVKKFHKKIIKGSHL